MIVIDILEEVGRVLDLEIEALQSVRRNLPVSIVKAVRSRNKPTAVLPVLDSNRRVVGMVHLHDLVAAGI